jgi:hypothetical protein
LNHVDRLPEVPEVAAGITTVAGMLLLFGLFAVILL